MNNISYSLTNQINWLEDFWYEIYPYVYLGIGLVALYTTNLVGFFSGYLLSVIALVIIRKRIAHRVTREDGCLF